MDVPEAAEAIVDCPIVPPKKAKSRKRKKKSKTMPAGQSQSTLALYETSHLTEEGSEPWKDGPSRVTNNTAISSTTNPSKEQPHLRAVQGTMAALEPEAHRLVDKMATLSLADPSSVRPASTQPQNPGTNNLPSRGDKLTEDADATNTATAPTKSNRSLKMPVSPSTRPQSLGKTSIDHAIPSTSGKGSKKSRENFSRSTEKGKTPKSNNGAASSEKSMDHGSVPTQMGDKSTAESVTVALPTGFKKGKAGKAQKNNQIAEESQQPQGLGEGSKKQENPKFPGPRNLGGHEISNAGRGSVEFKFDSNHPLLKCLKPDCRVLTSCWDTSVVICPACTAHSFTRYCKKEHLYEDIQRHWAMECCHNAVVTPIDRNTIRPSQLPNRPYTVALMPNILERHRQAVYRAMEDEDYFIFADLEQIDSRIAEPTWMHWNSVRGTGKLALRLRFADDGSNQSEKQHFSYHVQRALSLGKAGGAEDSCLRAFSMMRNLLIRSGVWREEIVTYICMQVVGEWSNFKVPEHLCDVALVTANWSANGLLPPLA